MKTLLFLLSIFTVLSIKSQHQVGHYTITFQDPERGNRNIETEIYYPATTAGNNTQVAAGEFPVIVFGHGFVMAWSAYENIWEEFVPRGYIMVFPRTEGSIFGTDHQQFGWDLEYLVTRMQAEGINASSPVFNAVAENTALMGHSMGGGASFLAADSLCTNGNTNLKTLIGLAPAESSTNGVSSINSSLSITVPSVILSGSQDGVTPAVDHHIPMYDNLASDCKTFINVLGGAHCYFANTNTACDFGEGTSSSGISISRTEQHQVTFDFVNLWLDFTLKSECDDFATFQDSLAVSSRVTHNQTCNYQPLSAVSSVVQPVCNGSSGSASLAITGGETAYTQDWGSANNTSLPSGTHNYIVIDAMGCSVTGSVVITDPAAITAVETIVQPTCSGLSDGSVSLAISGGTPTYTQNWGSANQNALSAGNYNYTITDANGCSATSSVTVTVADPIVVVETISQPTCSGLFDGSVSLSISGGTSGYTENWGTANQNALGAGNFTYTITDANGCSISNSVIITEPLPITTTETIINPTCNGSSNGSASLVVSGGTPGYTESWGSNNPNTLSAGNYSYTVTDANNCTYSNSINLTEPSVVAITETIIDPSCNGGTDGSIVLNVTGGTAGYSENWGGNNSNALSAGNYNVTVTDFNGCTASGSYLLTDPSLIDVITILNNPTCFGETNGTAVLNITGGTGVYTEDWSGFNPSALAAGTFTFEVEDANGCLFTDAVTLTAPSQIVVNSSYTAPSCAGENTGSATLQISGGSPSYTQDWGGQDPNALSAGTHNYIVTDSENCMQSGAITVTEPSLINVTSSVLEPTCFASNDGSVTLTISGGNPGYSETWSGIDPLSLVSGNYNVDIIDANGCTVTHNFTVTEPSELSITLTAEDEVLGSDGEITVASSGGTSGYEYSMNSGTFVSSNVFSGLDDGLYTITTQDANGCSVSDTITVFAPTSVGIDEEFLLGIKIYPIPMGDNLNIAFSNAVYDDSMTITLTNVVGELIMQRKITAVNGLEMIDVSNLPTGNYLLIVKGSSDVKSFKLVK